MYFKRHSATARTVIFMNVPSGRRKSFGYSHEWQVGDLVIWDNTGTLHRAEAYDPACDRLMHRTSLKVTSRSREPGWLRLFENERRVLASVD